MPLEIPCPSCGAVLRAPDSAAGRKARCKKCKHGFRLPGEKAAGATDELSQQLSAVEAPAFAFETPDATPPPAQRSKSKYKSSMSSAGGARPRGKAGLVLILVGVLGLVGAGVAAIVVMNESDKTKPQASAAKEKPAEPSPAEPAKEKEPPKAKPEPKPSSDVATKGADRKPRAALSGGLKLPAAPTAAKDIQKPTVGVSTETPFSAARTLLVSGGDAPLAVVLSAGNPGFQGQGAKDFLDRYNLATGALLERTEIEASAWPRACDLSPTGEQFISESPAGTLTLYDLTAKAKSGKPFQPFEGKSGLERVLFLSDAIALAVAKDGRLETWKAKEGERAATGTFGGPATAISLNSDRSLLAAVVGTDLVTADSKTLTAKPGFALARGCQRGFASALADTGERVAVAYRAAEPAPHTVVVVARLGDPKPAATLHLDDAWDAPNALHWCGAEAYTLTTARAVALTVDTEVNRPLATLFPQGGQAVHALTSGKHYALMPDPKDNKKSILLGVDFPPDDFLPLRNEAGETKAPVGFLLTPAGFGR